MSFNPPSKDEIKKKYSISNDDFDVLVKDKLPEPKELQNDESFIEKVADFLGVPTFLKKYKKTGIIVAILFLPGWISPVFNTSKDIIVTTCKFYQEKVIYLSDLIDDNSIYLVNYTDSNNIPKNKVDFDNLPIGSGIYGTSATNFKYFT